MPVRSDVLRRKLLDIGETVAISDLCWLVYDYATVDVGRVQAGLARLDDFEVFVADVELWLARGGR